MTLGMKLWGEGESIHQMLFREKYFAPKHSPRVFYSYGFGSLGKPKFQIPPDADLQYEIKLKSFEKVRKEALIQRGDIQRGWGENWP